AHLAAWPRRSPETAAGRPGPASRGWTGSRQCRTDAVRAARVRSRSCSWLNSRCGGGGGRRVREQIGVLIGVADQVVLLGQRSGTGGARTAGRTVGLGLDGRQCLGKDGFSQSQHALVAVDLLLQGLRAGRIDAVRRVTPGQTDDAPELALAHPALDGKEQLTQPPGVLTD